MVRQKIAGSLKGMLELYGRLFQAGVPVESHFFRNGVHGSGFAMGDPVLGEWTSLMSNWLAVGGFLIGQASGFPFRNCAAGR